MCSKARNPYSMLLAHSAAIGHFNAGMNCYQSFTELVDQADGLSLESRLARAISLGVPAITNLALGLELFLKVHHFQVSGSYPKGHNIGVLGANFPPPQMETLRTIYADLRHDPSIDQGTSFRVYGGPDALRQERPSPPDVSTYDLAIGYLGPAYVRWRYIYEELQQEIDVMFNFYPLYLTAKTVRDAISLQLERQRQEGSS